MKIAVIGGGAAGLMAAWAAADAGASVTLFEKNEKCGKKIYITGKGRCNVTNDCDEREYLSHVVNGSKFLTGAVYAFPPRALMEHLEDGGLRLKTERGNRVFPVSDKASDVTKCLENYCRSVGVNIKFNTNINSTPINIPVIKRKKLLVLILKIKFSNKSINTNKIKITKNLACNLNLPSNTPIDDIKTPV